eukprot:gene8491-9398_t
MAAGTTSTPQPLGENYKINVEKRAVTKAGESLQHYLGVTLNSLDFKIICKNCNRQVHSALENIQNRRQSFEEGRLRSSSFVRKSMKRLSSPSPIQLQQDNKVTRRKPPKKRHRLNFEDQSQSVQEKEHDPTASASIAGKVPENCPCLTTLPKLYVSCVQNMMTKNLAAIAHCIWADTQLKEEMQKLLYQEINLELKNLCSSSGTIFRADNDSLDKKIDFEAQEKELAGANKIAFARLNALSVTLSYPDTLNKQSALGVGFDISVREWMEKVAKEKAYSDWEIIAMDDGNASEEEPKISPCNTFRLLGDNCDLRSKCRSTTRTKAGTHKHLFINLAIHNTISGDIDTQYGYQPEKSYCPSLFLPNMEDNRHI